MTERRNVLNTCPVCKKTETFIISHKYEDEGHMVCTPCKHRAEEEREAKYEELEKESEMREVIMKVLREQGLIS